MDSAWTQAVRGTHLLWLPIPAYSAFPILLWFMHMRLWTFVLALSVCVALAVLKARGRTVGWIVRRFHCRLRGGVVNARPLWYRRRMQYLDSFDLVDLRQ
jgi:hypothetical protein